MTDLVCGVFMFKAKKPILYITLLLITTLVYAQSNQPLTNTTNIANHAVFKINGFNTIYDKGRMIMFNQTGNVIYNQPQSLGPGPENTLPVNLIDSLGRIINTCPSNNFSFLEITDIQGNIVKWNQICN
jgi:hypothetical protein